MLHNEFLKIISFLLSDWKLAVGICYVLDSTVSLYTQICDEASAYVVQASERTWFRQDGELFVFANSVRRI